MKRYRLKPHFLGFFFIFAVFTPSIVLSLLAVRAISREQAYVEKRLESTLLAEVIHVASLVRGQLKDIIGELDDTVGIPQEDVAEHFARWKKTSDLVDIPFLLSSSHQVLWPQEGKIISSRDQSFLASNTVFFNDEVRIPVYENVAVAYKEDIVGKQTNSLLTRDHRSVTKGVTKKNQDEVSSWGNARVTSQKGWHYESQQAMSEFDQYTEPVRKKVYEKAKEGGKQIAYRTVEVTKGRKAQPRQDEEKLESIFISEPLRFSEIIAQSDSGIIPRMADGGLNLLFWKKLENGRIVGCVIDQASFKERMLGILPSVYSSVRILTILDENGIPLITPQGQIRDWRKPFVARELSESLPHWEAVAYLTDPAMITSKVRFTASIMWMLIFILFASIVSGGLLILRLLYSEVQLAQKKTTFVANVSHELKTPLTSIRMFAEMLEEKRQPDETKRHKYLGIMVSETERLTRLINNVLDFSRMDRGKKQYTFKKVDLVFLTEDIVEGQRVRLENNGFEVNFRAHLSQVFVRADEEALRQVVLNLLSNAEKYSPDTKKIDIEVTGTEQAAFIDIKDRGVGISSQEAKYIFKEFYRVDDRLVSQTRGTGLGLTIARRIIRDHGGDIVYMPHEGGGSIFQIKLLVKE